MDAQNRCERRVVVRYYCKGQGGCSYFKMEPPCRNSYKARRGYCESYNYKGGECMSREAQAAADAEQGLLNR